MRGCVGAFLFVIYIGTKLFGGEDNTYVNVTGTMAFVAQVVNTMPAFGALGHSNSINENFLTVNQVVDATSAATSAWGVFIGIFGISILRSSNSNLIPSYAVYAGWIFYVLMFIFSVADNLELREKEEDFFYRMDNPPNVDTERSTYLNLTALCEWCMVFSFYTSALTYRKELEGISI